MPVYHLLRTIVWHVCFRLRAAIDFGLITWKSEKACWGLCRRFKPELWDEDLQSLGTLMFDLLLPETTISCCNINVDLYLFWRAPGHGHGYAFVWKPKPSWFTGGSLMGLTRFWPVSHFNQVECVATNLSDVFVLTEYDVLFHVTWWSPSNRTKCRSRNFN